MLGWLADKLTDLFRPWHDDGLPEELAFGEIEAWGFVRGAMVRAAKMAIRCDMAFGVFGVIGIEYAQRAARPWWPRERLLMEDVSCAFQPVASRAGVGKPVPQLPFDRLVLLLDRYLSYVGAPWEEEQIRDAIEQFIREASDAFLADEAVVGTDQDDELGDGADQPRE